MIVRLVEIPKQGRRYRETFTPGWLGGRVGFMESDLYRPLGPVDVDLNLTKHQKRVEVKGRVRTRLACVCSHCGADRELDVDLAVEELFLPAELAPRERGGVDLAPSDFRQSYYEDDEIDLGWYIAESLILALPDYPRCENSPECEAAEGGYREDWGEEEAKPEVNPAWRAGLESAKEILDRNDEN